VLVWPTLFVVLKDVVAADAAVGVGEEVVISANPTPAAAAAMRSPAARTLERPVQRNQGVLLLFTGESFRRCRP
jgi:hypothetical protein